MIHVRPVDRSVFSQAQATKQVLAGPQSGIESCVIAIAHSPPGTGEAEDRLAHDRMLFVLEGAIDASIRGEARTIASGSLLFAPAGTAHGYVAAGPEPALVLDILAIASRTAEAEVVAIDTVDELVRSVTGEGFMAHMSHRARGEPFGVQTLADRATGARAGRLFAAMVQPGSGMERHIHRFDQFYFVLSGEFHIEVGLSTMTAGPGSLVVLPAGSVHRNWNEGEVPVAELTFIVPQPPAGEPLSIAATLNVP